MQAWTAAPTGSLNCIGWSYRTSSRPWALSSVTRPPANVTEGEAQPDGASAEHAKAAPDSGSRTRLHTAVSHTATRSKAHPAFRLLLCSCGGVCRRVAREVLQAAHWLISATPPHVVAGVHVSPTGPSASAQACVLQACRHRDAACCWQQEHTSSLPQQMGTLVGTLLPAEQCLQVTRVSRGVRGSPADVDPSTLIGPAGTW